MNLSGWNLVGGLIFGAIGFVAFVYGKKQSLFKAMGIGVALIVFPYFISNTWALYAVGIVLTFLLFLWRD